MEAHHLIEKRFKNQLGISEGDILSIGISKDLHNQITAKMRNKIPYDSWWKGKDELTTSTAKLEDIWKATRETYDELGLQKFIEPAKEMFKKAGLAID